MSLELIVTSAPRGLKPNSSGFCTVAATAGMAKQVMMKLEALSGYEFRFNLSDPNASLNPTNCAYTQIKAGSEVTHVLSRVAFCGADYSGRTNKIAHHFVLSPDERLANGPAWMLRQMASGVFAPSWDDSPGELAPRSLNMLEAAQASHRSGPARQWEQVTGDAGWGGMLAKAFHESRNTPAFVIFEPGVDLLPLFEESLALLPGPEKWAVSFATYYTTMPTGCHYHWRGVLAGSTAAREIARFPNATVIDLRKGPLGKADDSPYANAARMGAIVELPREETVPGKKSKKPLKKPEIPAFFGFDAKKVRVPSAPDAATPSESPAFAGSDFADSDANRRVRRAYGKAKMLAAGLALFAAALLVGNLVTCRRLSAERTEKNSARRELASARGKLKSSEGENTRLRGDKKAQETRIGELTKRLELAKSRSKTAVKPRTPLRITTDGGLPAATAAKLYKGATLRVAGHSSGLKWEIIKGSGSLPDGLSLNPRTGRISGTPRKEGPSKFTVQVASARRNDNTSPGTKVFRITVRKAAGSGDVTHKPGTKAKRIELIDFGKQKGTPKHAEIAKEDKGKSIQFRVPAFDAIVALPKQFQGTSCWFRTDRDGSGVAVEYKTVGGDEETLFHLKRGPEEGLLVWDDMARTTAKGYSLWLDYFVVLAVRRTNGRSTIYQCARKRKEFRPELKALYDDDGNMYPSDTSRGTFYYPWPDALQVQHPDLKGGEPLAYKNLPYVKGREEKSVRELLFVIKRTLPKYQDFTSGKGKGIAASELIIEVVLRCDQKWDSKRKAKKLTARVAFISNQPGLYIRAQKNGLELMRGSQRRREEALPGLLQNAKEPMAKWKPFDEKAHLLERFRDELQRLVNQKREAAKKNKKKPGPKKKGPPDGGDKRPEPVEPHKFPLEKLKPWLADARRALRRMPLKHLEGRLHDVKSSAAKARQDATKRRKASLPLRELDKCHQELGRLNELVPKLDAAVKQSKHQPQRLFQKLPPLNIVDPWGLPVATIALKVARQPAKQK